MDGKAEGPGMGTEAEEAGEETPLLRRTGDGTSGQQDAAFKERVVSATAAFSCTFPFVWVLG